jgi:uncharacterized membrane protein YphA (DoxX/SURF4 family)/peroxiredoxin
VLGQGAGNGFDALLDLRWGEPDVSAVLVFARLALAVVFAAAGAGKLADLPGSRRAVRTFGVPAGLAEVIGTLLPLAELAVAVCLIGSGSARWGAGAGLVLLSGFAIGIGVALRGGRQPDCHCFGQLHSAPVGRRTLTRNLAFLSVAALVALAGPGPSLSSWFGSRSPEQVWVAAAAVAALIVGGQAALIWSLLRRHGAALLRLRELEAGGASDVPALIVGARAPAFDLPGVDGERISLAGLLSAGRGVLLVFTDPRCGPCQALLPQLAAWQDSHPDHLTVALLSRGSTAENRSARDEFGLRHIALQKGREADLGYGVIGTPSAVIIGADGRVAGPLVTGAERIGELAALQLRSSPPVAALAADRLGERGAIIVDPPAAHDGGSGAGTERRSVIGVSTGALVAAGVTAVAVSPAAAAEGNERIAANRIAGELGELIRRIAPETFVAGQALHGTRVTASGKPISVPAAARAAWHRRLLDIDRAHASISRISGADASRTAALHAVEVLRSVCQSGQLAITSPSAAKQNQHASQQAAEEVRLRTAVERLTASLQRAGATHL